MPEWWAPSKESQRISSAHPFGMVIARPIQGRHARKMGPSGQSDGFGSAHPLRHGGAVGLSKASHRMGAHRLGKVKVGPSNACPRDDFSVVQGMDNPRHLCWMGSAHPLGMMRLLSSRLPPAHNIAHPGNPTSPIKHLRHVLGVSPYEESHWLSKPSNTRGKESTHPRNHIGHSDNPRKGPSKGVPTS